MKKSNVDYFCIFISPPSMGILELRLRQTEIPYDEDHINNALINASREIAYAKGVGNYDKFLINDNLKDTFESLVVLVKEWYPHLNEKEELNTGDIYRDCREYCIIS